MLDLAWSERSVHGPTRFEDTLAPIKNPVVSSGINFRRDVAVFAFKTPSGDSEAAAIARFKSEGFPGRTGIYRQDTFQPPKVRRPECCHSCRRRCRYSSRVDDTGKLDWNVPDGEWTILRMGYIPTGSTNEPAPSEGRGLEVDKLSRSALDVHWAGMMGKITADLGPLAGSTLNNVLIDSYEVGSQNWTPKMREEFKRLRGYDPSLTFLRSRAILWEAPRSPIASCGTCVAPSPISTRRTTSATSRTFATRPA